MAVRVLLAGIQEAHAGRTLINILTTEKTPGAIWLTGSFLLLLFPLLSIYRFRKELSMKRYQGKYRKADSHQKQNN